MHVVVVGAGLLGVTSAYFLRRHGLEVTVLDRQSGPALETSYANGGYIQSSAPDPWNAPGIVKILARAWLAGLGGGGDDASYVARSGALPGLFRWGLQFLRNANRAAYFDNTIKNMRLATYTRQVMAQLRERETLSYAQSEAGALCLFRAPEALAKYRELAEHVGKYGERFEALGRRQLLEKEPSLTHLADELVGAIYYPDDESGNARQFCMQLERIGDALGAKFSYSTLVRRIDAAPKGLRIETDQGIVDADAIVLAAGSFTKELARPIGINLPIAPAKGYSISVPMNGWSGRPTNCIVDMRAHAAVNPLGECLRVVAGAEFAGMDTSISLGRIDYLIGLVRQLYPDFAATIDPTRIDPWAGLRPLCADGMPIIGSTPIPNVYLNTGHGGLGWTQAAGSAKALADQIAGVEPEFAIDEFSLERF